jgi:hypothetical protein
MPKDPRGKKQTQGPLAGHFKVDRKYRPPLMTYERLVPSEWARDDLPDLLWPLVLVELAGDETGALIGRVQEAVLKGCERGALEVTGAAIDGRLTSLERFRDDQRRQLVRTFEVSTDRSQVFPPELVGVLSLYDDVPGAWLLLNPWRGSSSIPSADDSINLLAQAVVAAIAEPSANAMVKASTISWNLRSGKTKIPREVGEVLVGYPLDAEKRPEAEATILSSFLASKTADSISHPEWIEERNRWTKSFWEQNRLISSCIVQDPVVPSERESSDEEPPVSADDVAKHLSRAEALYRSYLEAAFGTSVKFEDFTRHEVLVGLVSRAFRSLEALLRAPHLWSGELASPVSRQLIETHILITWMLRQDADVFQRYQSYGFGKRKLMRRHVQDLLQKTGDEAPEMLKDLAESLERATGGDWSEQFQVVNLDSTFAGVSVRQMAEEADLLDEYRHVYQPASGVSHGEWWAVEDYAVQRCMNPLHFFHQVPSVYEFPPEPRFADVVIDYLDRVIETALSGLSSARPSSEG